jgi:hypothetical protein
MIENMASMLFYSSKMKQLYLMLSKKAFIPVRAFRSTPFGRLLDLMCLKRYLAIGSVKTRFT